MMGFLVEGVKGVASENLTKSLDLPKFSSDIENSSISSFKQADLTVIKGPINNNLEDKEFKTVDEALEDATIEERKIYDEANLEQGEVNGKETLERTDIDYDEKDDLGRTNLERMDEGLAPLKDGKPIELHHIGQEMDSPIAELTKEEHMQNGNDTILHDKQKESTIDRNEFKKEREEHWKERSEQVREERGEYNV